MSTATFQIWRGNRPAGRLPTNTGPKVTEGHGGGAPDVIHKIQAETGQRSRGCAGTAKPGKVRLVLSGNQRHAEADVAWNAQWNSLPEGQSVK